MNPQTSKRRFYLAGPMRGYPKFNFPAFDAAAAMGRAAGFEVISPADLDRERGFDENVETEAADNGPETARIYVDADTKALLSLRAENGDGIALLPGWEKSTGALCELCVAKWLHLEVVDATTWKPFTSNPLDELHIRQALLANINKAFTQKPANTLT